MVVLYEKTSCPSGKSRRLGSRWGKRIESVRPLVTKDQKGEGGPNSPN